MTALLSSSQVVTSCLILKGAILANCISNSKSKTKVVMTSWSLIFSS